MFSAIVGECQVVGIPSNIVICGDGGGGGGGNGEGSGCCQGCVN